MGQIPKCNLGTVRMLQERYDEALGIGREAREIFSSLGETAQVATAWHQTAMVYRQAGQHDQAEGAYRQALALRVQLKDRKGEADTLGELGNLYDAMGRREEAVTFYRQAADIYVEIGDLINEGRARNNLADTLIKLGRFDEARREVERAIECKKPYGHAAEPWKAWAILHDLERAAGNPEAAARARQQAMEAFLAYRRDGGGVYVRLWSAMPTDCGGRDCEGQVYPHHGTRRNTRSRAGTHQAPGHPGGLARPGAGRGPGAYLRRRRGAEVAAGGAVGDLTPNPLSLKGEGAFGCLAFPVCCVCPGSLCGHPSGVWFAVSTWRSLIPLKSFGL